MIYDTIELSPISPSNHWSMHLVKLYLHIAKPVNNFSTSIFAPQLHPIELAVTNKTTVRRGEVPQCPFCRHHC